ncbi:MAG: hypothetical protein Q8P30_03595, partial [Candidatus Uhrbacteria bacterium]|nr:hypothetical protein [Candidatus Uhrbacteria bacterium]
MKLIGWTKIVAKLFWYLASNRKIGTGYITCSRSVGGAFRDIISIGVFKIFHVSVINHIHGSDLISFYKSKRWRLLKYCHRAMLNKCSENIVLTESMKFELSGILNNSVVVNNFSNISCRFIERDIETDICICYY